MKRRYKLNPNFAKPTVFHYVHWLHWVFFSCKIGRQQNFTDERPVCILETELCQKLRLLLLDAEAQSWISNDNFPHFLITLKEISGNRGDLHIKLSLQRQQNEPGSTLGLGVWDLSKTQHRESSARQKVQNILLILTARVPKFRHLLMGLLKKEAHLHLINSRALFSRELAVFASVQLRGFKSSVCFISSTQICVTWTKHERHLTVLKTILPGAVRLWHSSLVIYIQLFFLHRAEESHQKQSSHKETEITPFHSHPTQSTENRLPLSVITQTEIFLCLPGCTELPQISSTSKTSIQFFQPSEEFCLATSWQTQKF